MNCIKNVPIQHSQGYELLLKRTTEINKSPKKLDVSSLKDHDTTDNSERVTVLVKAMSNNPPDTVSDKPHLSSAGAID